MLQLATRSDGWAFGDILRCYATNVLSKTACSCEDGLAPERISSVSDRHGAGQAAQISGLAMPVPNRKRQQESQLG
jgi:hypothetical protein